MTFGEVRHLPMIKHARECLVRHRARASGITPLEFALARFEINDRDFGPIGSKKINQRTANSSTDIRRVPNERTLGPQRVACARSCGSNHRPLRVAWIDVEFGT